VANCENILRWTQSLQVVKIHYDKLKRWQVVKIYYDELRGCKLWKYIMINSRGGKLWKYITMDREVTSYSIKSVTNSYKNLVSHCLILHPHGYITPASFPLKQSVQKWFHVTPSRLVRFLSLCVSYNYAPFPAITAPMSTSTHYGDTQAGIHGSLWS
jgi:hypothetical protein